MDAVKGISQVEIAEKYDVCSSYVRQALQQAEVKPIRREGTGRGNSKLLYNEAQARKALQMFFNRKAKSAMDRVLMWQEKARAVGEK